MASTHDEATKATVNGLPTEYELRKADNDNRRQMRRDQRKRHREEPKKPGNTEE